MRAPNGWDEIRRFYGWEDRFLVNLAAWEARMTFALPPQGARLYYDGNADGVYTPNEQMKRGIRVHAAIKDELEAALRDVHAAGLWSYVISCGGGYVFRTQRGNVSRLSMHAMGAAVDFDPRLNPLGNDPGETSLGTAPGLGVVRIFKERGWTWGGDWARPDAMHFQWGGGF